MRIQHNIAAMNSYRNYANNVSQVSKNLEKLSTGYKVNRAGDDAAGLAISEKMRIQITGLEKAQDNAKAGINLVQTAEGALAEVHDMLNRMYDLAEQSANGTFDDTTDRKQLQKEVDSLRDEIDRIADSTNYNGIQLLDGSMDRKTVSSAVTDLFKTDQTKSALTVIQDGDPGQKAQAGVFELNLKDVVLTSTDDTKELTLNIFGKSVSLGKRGVGESIGGEKLVNAIVEAWNQANPDVKAGDGTIKMTASRSLDKQSVVFTMNNPPASDWGTASDVSFNTEGNDAAYTINGAQSLQVRVDVEPVATDKPRTYAQAKFDLKADMIADGRTLQIGDETYVFAVGRNSAYKDMDHIIDLTDFEAADFDPDNPVDENIKTAAMRLTEAASGNSMFKVSTHTGTVAGATGTDKPKSSTIYLTEREGAVDYTVNDLKGKATDDTKPATATDGNWTGLVRTGIVDSNSSTNGLTLQIGDTSEKFNQLNISIKDIHVSALNLSKINIGEQGGAQTAMDIIKAATNYVSDVRGGLGALQNRLDHTINNLSVAQENIQDAESVIRDVDVADEMMAYTKNNILVQSAQAMLAQANQLPQGVLQLLG